MKPHGLNSKKNGYLKIYIQPSSDHGCWNIQYELLDQADLANGVHTYYCTLAGEITGTNISKKEKKQLMAFCSQPSVQETDHYPPNGGNGQHTPLLGIYAKGTYANDKYAEGCNANEDNNIILPHNTPINTLNNHSIHQGLAKRSGDSTLIEQVIDDLISHESIPHFYANDRTKMEAAIHFLTDWDSRQQYPYTTPNGSLNEQKMHAFNFCIDCLIDMACASDLRNYRGAQITSTNVIDAINRISDNCSEGGLCDFLDEAMDSFTNAYGKTEIRDLRKYVMSIIWNCFSTYKVKQDIALLG